MRTSEIHVVCSLEVLKLQKEVKRQCIFVFLMAKAIPLTKNRDFLRKRITHSGRRSGGARRSNGLLGFWSHLDSEIFGEDWKKLEVLWVQKSSRALFKRGSERR